MLRKESAKHAQRVYSSVRWSDTPYKDSDDDNRLLRSWERSLEDYRLDPGRTAQPRILTAASLRDHLEPLESFLRIAKHGVRTLYEQVADASYAVLLTDGDGVTIDFVGNALQDRELKKAGLYLGSVWTESEEGTCDVGTAIIDKKPIVLHKPDRATKSLHGDGTNTAHATAPFKIPGEMSPNGLIPGDGLRTSPAAEQDERMRIIATLRAHKWQVHATARALGMSRATIYRKLAKHSIVSPNKAESAEPSIPEKS